MGGEKIGPLKPFEKEACRSLVISIMEWTKEYRMAGLLARPFRSSRGDRARSGQKPLETRKVEKIHRPQALRPEKAFGYFWPTKVTR